MNIAITGSTGFVAGALKDHWGEKHHIINISREELYGKKQGLREKLENADVVIHLAGKPIITRWTKKAKRGMFESRVITTRNIVEALKEGKKKPGAFLCASAIGIYDDGVVQDEQGKMFVSNFLRDIIEGWEGEARKAEKTGIRTVIMRFGLILGRNGGLMKKLRTPFLIGMGGIIGSGKQGCSFIHINDLVRAVEFIIQRKKSAGLYNITAPGPVNNREFTKTLGRIMKRPARLRFPSLLLRLVFSEGSIALTKGQKVIPGKLIKEGFIFKFPTIEKTLSDIVESNNE